MKNLTPAPRPELTLAARNPYLGSMRNGGSWSRSVLVRGCTMAAAFAGSLFAAESASIPTGGVTITIAAGTGATRTTSAFSLPMLMRSNAQGAMSGRITGVTSSTISNSAAGWQAGQLSTAQVPHFIRIMSGAATGRSFLISTQVASANTETTVTIDSTENTDLTTLGIVTGSSGDTYQIYAADTLSTLFPPGSGVLGGASAAAADNVLLNLNGIWRTYFFNTATSRWTQFTLGSPDASNVPIRPDAAIQYTRLAATTLTLRIMGEVPRTNRKVPLLNQGVTFLASGWPTDITLSSSQLHLTPGWRSGSIGNADTVLLISSGIWRRYFHDGSNWRQFTLGNPLANSQLVPAGAAMLIDRAAGAGRTTMSQSRPYEF